MSRVMLALLVERLLLILMVGGELMEGVPFLERIQQRLIVQPATVPDGLLNPWWLMV